MKFTKIEDIKTERKVEITLFKRFSRVATFGPKETFGNKMTFEWPITEVSVTKAIKLAKDWIRTGHFWDMKNGVKVIFGYNSPQDYYDQMQRNYSQMSSKDFGQEVMQHYKSELHRLEKSGKVVAKKN